MLTVNPAPDSVEFAAWAVSPTTPGTFCWGGPVDMNNVTPVPRGTLAAAAGLVLIAWPWEIPRDDVGTTRVTLRWPFFSVFVASVWLSPWTLGTSTLPLPLETVSVIVEPLSTLVRPAGDSLMTIPGGLPFWTWTSEVAKPALVRIASAMLTCWPTT